MKREQNSRQPSHNGLNSEKSGDWHLTGSDVIPFAGHF
jgi:hypothetical protein